VAQGHSQAMLYATGLTEQDMDKPQIGSASMWYEGNPCNMHLLDLAKKVHQGVVATDMVGMRFNTIGVSDGISMGTDGMSFSGGSHGFIVGHITPEAQEGGTLALVRDGDTITIDAVNNQLRVHLSDEELSGRRQNWTAPPYKAQQGTLYKYIKSVRSASEGCVTDA